MPNPKTKSKPKPLLDRARQLADEGALEQLRQLRSVSAKVAQLQMQLKLEQRKREQAEAELSEAEHWREFLASVSSLETDVRIKPPKRGKGGRTQTTPIICCCDWHTEQEVDPRTVNGVNEFNLEIARTRITRLWHKAVYFINLWKELADIHDAVLWLGGDLISGSIHEELQEVNQLGPVDATSLVVDHVTAGIHYLLEQGNLDRVHVVCNIGNHGRTVKKPRHATAFQHSYESSAFLRIQDRCHNMAEVTWQIGRAYHAYLMLYDRWQSRFHHGDNIRYYGGVGGITIPVNKAIAEWNKMRHADVDIFGHWHQYLEAWNFVACGCLVGFDPFAVSIKASYQPPTQTIVFLDSEKGKVGAIPLFV